MPVFEPTINRENINGRLRLTEEAYRGKIQVGEGQAGKCAQLLSAEKQKGREKKS